MTTAADRAPIQIEAYRERIQQPSRRPNMQYLLGLVDEARLRFAARNARINKILKLYFREHDVVIPEEFQQWTDPVKTHTVESTCQGAVDKLTEGRPTVSMTPVDEGPKARATADRIECWDNAALKQLEAQIGREVYCKLAWWAVTAGLGYLYAEFTPQSWDEYTLSIVERGEDEDERDHDARVEDEKRRAPLPFFLTDLDPRGVFPFRDIEGIREVLIGEERLRLQVAGDYNLQLGRDEAGNAKLKPSTMGEAVAPVDEDTPSTGWGTVTFWRHITRARNNRPGYVTYFADGVLLKQYRHYYPGVPVWEVTGRSTPLREPERATRSIVDPILDIVPEIDSQLTMSHNYTFIQSFPQLIEKTDPNSPAALDDGKPKEPLQFEPGKAARLAPGKDLLFLQAPMIGQSLVYNLDRLQGEVDKVSPLPPILQGIAPKGVDSGYMTNQIRREARTFRQPYLSSISLGYEGAIQYLHWAIVNLVHEDVYVLATDPKDKTKKNQTFVAIGPEDLKRYYSVSVSIVADAPEQDITLMRAGIEAWQAGAITWEYMLEAFAKIPNASQMIDDKRLEDLFETPQMKQFIIIELLKRRGLQDEVENAAEQTGQNVMGPAQVPLNSPLVDAGASNGAGLGPAAPLEPVAEPIPPGMGGGSQGGLYGVGIAPNTQFAPGGMPV